jgi:hypothetical protein
LQDFDLQVEVKVLVVPLDRVQVLQLGDEPAGEHGVVDEHLANPLPGLPENVHLPIVEGELLAEELIWAELYIFWLVLESLGREEGPGAVEEDICRELLLVLVEANGRSVDPNDVANFLADWQILELACEKNESAKVDISCLLVNPHAGVSDLH